MGKLSAVVLEMPVSCARDSFVQRGSTVRTSRNFTFCWATACLHAATSRSYRLRNISPPTGKTRRVVRARASAVTPPTRDEHAHCSQVNLFGELPFRWLHAPSSATQRYPKHFSVSIQHSTHSWVRCAEGHRSSYFCCAMEGSRPHRRSATVRHDTLVLVVPDHY